MSHLVSCTISSRRTTEVAETSPAKQITETDVIEPQLLEFDQQIDQVLFLVTARDGHPRTVDDRSETCKRSDQSRGPLKINAEPLQWGSS